MPMTTPTTTRASLLAVILVSILVKTLEEACRSSWVSRSWKYEDGSVRALVVHFSLVTAWDSLKHSGKFCPMLTRLISPLD